STTIGDEEKHTIRVEAKVSALTGGTNKYVYVDDVLVWEDERPIV
ncbi:unnamed protein product, partial [marine sediment metagenome]